MERLPCTRRWCDARQSGSEDWVPPPCMLLANLPLLGIPWEPNVCCTLAMHTQTPTMLWHCWTTCRMAGHQQAALHSRGACPRQTAQQTDCGLLVAAAVSRQPSRTAALLMEHV